MVLFPTSKQDEMQQSFTVKLWLRQSWLDVRLAWNASEYGGIQETTMQADMVWVPDTFLYDSVDLENHDLFDRTTRVMVNSDGSVYWLLPRIVKGTCLMDLKKYPYDVQICVLKFGSWIYAMSRIDYVQPENMDHFQDYIVNDQWVLLNLTSSRNTKKYGCCPDEFVDISYKIKLKRAAGYPTTILSSHQ